MCRLYGIVTIAWMLIGCTSPQSADVNSLSVTTQRYQVIDNTERLPAISVYSTWLSEQEQARCEAFTQASEYQRCIEDPIDATLYYHALKRSHAFERTTLSSPGCDYDILIATAGYQFHQQATRTADNNLRQKITAEIQINWRGIELTTLSYQLDYLSQANEPTPGQHFADKLMRHFIKDARQKRIFSADYLFTNLNASNYHEHLTVPDSISGFTIHQQQLFHDPLQGVMIRYLHPDYQDETLDLYVYPVAANDLSKTNQILHYEIDRERRDIGLIANAREISVNNLDATDSITWHTDSGTHIGMSLSVNALDNFQQTIYASTYVFVVKDKVVKFSTNLPAHIASRLVKEALPQLQVPDQSKLMAQLRNNTFELAKLNSGAE